MVHAEIADVEQLGVALELSQVTVATRAEPGIALNEQGRLFVLDVTVATAMLLEKRNVGRPHGDVMLHILVARHALRIGNVLERGDVAGVAIVAYELV
jgi:hypothetical protein